MRRALSVVLLMAACSGAPGSSSTSSPVIATVPEATTTAATGPTATVVAPPTTSTPLPPLPDLAGELAWFAPLPPLITGEGRPFTGSGDFMDLFVDGADWEAAAAHLEVFKLYGEWVAYGASDAELRAAVQGIRARGLALAVEAGPLDPPPDCGHGVEGFAGSEEGHRIARRIEDAGGTIDLIALDEPYYFASIYDGPGACHWPAEKVAAEVAEYIALMRSHFPDVVVGDTEPTPHPVTAATYPDWLRTFRAVAGYDLAFLHLDIDWSRTDWPDLVESVVEFGRGFGVPVGMIYIGNGADPSDAVYAAITGERVLRLEEEYGVRPPHVLFQSWVDHPDFVLPEGDPTTFTGIVLTYFERREGLGFPRDGTGANLARGRDARASRRSGQAHLAVDGDAGTVWSAEDFPAQWIEVELDGPSAIAAIRLIPSQFPAGPTRHRVLGRGPDTGGFRVLGVLEGETADGTLLEITGPWIGIATIRVETDASPSWVAWREIEVVSS